MSAPLRGLAIDSSVQFFASSRSLSVLPSPHPQTLFVGGAFLRRLVVLVCLAFFRTVGVVVALTHAQHRSIKLLSPNVRLRIVVTDGIGVDRLGLY